MQDISMKIPSNGDQVATRSILDQVDHALGNAFSGGHLEKTKQSAIGTGKHILAGISGSLC